MRSMSFIKCNIKTIYSSQETKKEITGISRPEGEAVEVHVDLFHMIWDLIWYLD